MRHLQSYHRGHETQKRAKIRNGGKKKVAPKRHYPTDSLLPVLSSKQDANRTATLFPSFLRVVIVTISPYPRPPHCTMYHHHHDERTKEKKRKVCGVQLCLLQCVTQRYYNLLFVISSTRTLMLYHRCCLYFVGSFVCSFVRSPVQLSDLYIPSTCQWRSREQHQQQQQVQREKGQAP